MECLYLPAVRRFLLQPYPFTEHPVRKLGLCAGIGLFIALFLGVFKPFGFDELPVATAWLHAFLYGIVTAVVSALLQILLPLLFPKPFREEGWRSWKEIVYLLITTAAIGGGNFWLSLYLYGESGTLRGFLWTELMTLQIGVFPILFIVFLKQIKFYRRYADEAKTVSNELEEKKKEEQDAEGLVSKTETAKEPEPTAVAPRFVLAEEQPPLRLRLRGDNQNETLFLLPQDLLYLASADNYVNVRYRENGQEKSSLLRGSLKGFEQQLKKHDTFFRCHRMYIVNLQAVKDVSGNAQGLKLHLAGSDEVVPVSRSLTDAVKERLHALFRLPQNA